VALAILRAQEAQILLLDEPANHLDPAQQRTTYKNLGDLWRKGHGLVCVTHDINLLGALERPNEETPIRVIGMGHGELVFDSHYDAPELPELLSDLFGVPFTAVDHAGSRYLLIAGEGR
jgi:iron complex transport system ATP-binding protein